jgi:hypothetical protein
MRVVGRGPVQALFPSAPPTAAEPLQYGPALLSVIKVVRWPKSTRIRYSRQRMHINHGGNHDNLCLPMLISRVPTTS